MAGGFGATPAFGQQNTGFPTTGGFGSPLFGAGNNTGGLFGATQNTPGGLFSGGTLTSSNSTGFGGTSGTGLFGSTNTGGPFSQQNNAFPLSKPVEAASTSPGSGGLFQNTSNTFGGSSFSSQNGTTVKFNPQIGSEMVVSKDNNNRGPISTRHQCITAMKEYENKSLEELRLEDYLAGRRGPSNTQPPSTNTMFRSPSNTGPSSGQLKNGFGANVPGGFGTGNLFGLQTQGQQTSTFKPFDQTGSAKPNTELQANATRSSLFGPSPAPGGLFPPKSPTSTATLAPGTGQCTNGIFGNQTSTATHLGTGTGLFPKTNTNTPFGMFAPHPSTTTNLSSGTGLFSKTNTNAPFGTFAPQPSTTTNLNSGAAPFGQNSFGTFGPQPKGLNTGVAPFGQTNTNIGTTSTQLPSMGPSLGTGTPQLGPANTNIGNVGTQQNMFDKKPSVFGTNTTSPFGTGLFGNNTPGTTGLGLPSSNLSFGPQQPDLLTDPGAREAQEELLKRQFKVLNCSPFGDSPLFRNTLTDTKKKEERLKSTHLPRLTTPTHFKRSPQRATMHLPKSLTPRGPGPKPLLFAGLDEELSITKGAFKPRKSFKRLVLKDVSSRVANIVEEDEIRPRPDPQDTICDFSLHKAHNQRSTKQVTGGDESELERRDEQKEGKEDQQEKNEKQENQAPPPHPAGIVLSRFGYYTIPPMEELADFVDENSQCLVENFTVGRKDYGSVYFPGVVNVFGLNLDDIVHFRRTQVIVYPDDALKPAQGEGLNRRAEVTLDRVWPLDKTNGSEIRTPERIDQVGFQSRLEIACRRQGGKFLEYRYETGSWVFEVSHF